ncbi:uncharacterized protein LOC128231320 [Mya arenaria]|uniref:uncharacterized protein LOC128231320 n=1 Tax=Mya arenaria TaxID=6604 RepID=UPI0022E0E73E|nr:uncharacterized protein LOC128231320 [Mya arenaria]
MAEAQDDPIVICSDDDSDNDDVVLIKEEIEVDSDDVIFLSETKAVPVTPTDSSPSVSTVGKGSTGRHSPDKTQNNGSGLGLQRSDSLATCTNRLSIDDDGTKSLSSSSTLLDTQGMGNGGTDCTIYPQSGDANMALDLSTRSDGPSSKASGDNCGTVSGSHSNTPVNSGGGLQQIVDTWPPAAASCADVMPQAGLNTSSDHQLIVTSSTSSVAGDKHPFHSWPNLDLKNDKPDYLRSNSATDSSILCTNSSSDTSMTSVASVSNSIASNMPITYSSFDQATKCTWDTVSAPGCIAVTSSNSLVVVSSIGNSVPYQTPDVLTTKPDQLPVSSSVVTNVSATAPHGHSAPGVSTLGSNQQPSSLSSDLFASCRNLLSYLDLFAPDNNKDNQNTSVPTANNIPPNNGSRFVSHYPGDSSNGQTTPTLACMPSFGGYTPTTSVQGSTYFRYPSMFMDSSTLTSSSISQTGTSPTSSAGHQSFPPLYNPLTLPLSKQSMTLKRSLSTSGVSGYVSGARLGRTSRQQSWYSDSNSSKSNQTAQSIFGPRRMSDDLPRIPSPTHPHSLPPKKQRRCYTCAKCGVNLNGEKSSQCGVGHHTCSCCLEDRVKLVLTGKAKESVKCLNDACNNYYPIYELRKSLPAMVVEILEDKLDKDYVDCISDMILKAAEEEMEIGEGSLPALETTPDRQFEDCPGHWDPMNEIDVNKKGYVQVMLEVGSPEYEEVTLRFFESMVDHNVEVTAVYRIQNPIQWKYYTVKRSEMVRDNEGFESVVEGNLFHGTNLNVVEAISRKGFDWRVCGKHGTMYGQGSYFAVNASYSHRYTDLQRPQSIRSSMTMYQPMLFSIPSHSNSLYLNMNQNAGSPATSAQNLVSSSPINLSSNPFPAHSQHIQGPGSQPGHTLGAGPGSLGNVPTPTSLGLGSLRSLQPIPVQPGQPGPSSGITYMANRTLMSCTKKPLPVVPKPLQIRQISGLASTALATNIESNQEPERNSAKMFFAKVLIGRYTEGLPKLRKPPPRFQNDPFGKCFDSCVDNVDSPKIFVIFDSSQAYPEYLIEYTYGS